MSAVKSFLRNRIAMYLVMVSMIMSFVIPSIRTDYSDLAGLNHSAHEIHILDLRGMSDCILTASTSGKQSGEYRDANSGKTASGIISTGGAFALPDPIRLVYSLINGITFAPAPPGIRTISSFLIISIHLKDGNK